MTAPDDIKRVVVLDTSVASTNLGDQIIMQAVRGQLDVELSGALHTAVASHDTLGRKGRGLVRKADLVVAGGTNLIASHMWLRSVWRLTPLDAFNDMKVVLMGVGWYQFQSKPDPYTAWLLKRVLHPTALHSVRDSYTGQMLASIGINNTINTGCPTLWGLTPERCRILPKTKARSVATTLNTYIKDVEADRKLLDLLSRRYDKVYAWVQTAEDHAYIRGLGPNVVILEPSLKAYDDLLTSDEDLDYVGNRLHGGVRALQHGRRAIIIEVDNRAKEMGRDFALPVVERHDFAKLDAMIDGPLEIAVKPPEAAIARWKADLKSQLAGAR